MRIHPGKRSNYKVEDVEDAAAVLVMISGARTRGCEQYGGGEGVGGTHIGFPYFPESRLRLV